ncbi:TPA: hypothetical protein MCB68_005392 [Klebsiella pneumoniae]|nr:hypothetical protein [Escherichia coli]HBT5886538.1 hypothetical protein [Klebsiella pneumoniae]HBW5292732.1 hypothetical protein [Klebsiella pneumoniae]HDS8648378.1 hypothetical protein [Escherichia coli]HDT0588025.1 hypothetical protein [Escherichia coli]
MSVMFKMKNPIFNAHDLYVMIRLSMIKYFPYDTTGIEPGEVLSVYLQKAQGLDIEIENGPEENGLVRCLIFSGKSYDIYKDIEKEENGPFHSPAWYVSQVAKWRAFELRDLHDDMDRMRSWLILNDYVKENLPTDKFLQQEFLIIADVAAERKSSR